MSSTTIATIAIIAVLVLAFTTIDNFVRIFTCKNNFERFIRIVVAIATIIVLRRVMMGE